jgi:hypothetical protein
MGQDRPTRAERKAEQDYRDEMAIKQLRDRNALEAKREREREQKDKDN